MSEAVDILFHITIDVCLLVYIRKSYIQYKKIMGTITLLNILKQKYPDCNNEVQDIIDYLRK